jgi:signal transduction histidine kinase
VSRSRGLSLRARMLVLLVGVITVLLVVMGSVSTYLFARWVDGQIADHSTVLRQRAAALAVDCSARDYSSTFNYCARAIGALPGSYAVVAVPVRAPLTAIALRSGPGSGQLARAVNARLGTPGFAQVRQLVAAGYVSAAEMRVSAGSCAAGLTGSAGAASATFPYLNCPPFDVGQNTQAVAKIVKITRRSQVPVVTSVPGAVVLFVGQSVSTEPSQVRGFIIAELITGAALIALVAVAGEWLIGRGLEPLYEMAATANEITTRGDLTARMPDADEQTEVGRLGTSINTMLDRIQQAFSMRLHSEQKVREFAADASHELRTPLTTIRGYAELYRQGALGPDQLPSAMRRIEQEARRMSTLVAELLELARLDRTSSLDLTETDLAAVVRDAVADAVAVQPQRPVRAEAPPRLVAVVDEPRVRQVIANLLGNVRAHTPASTPVAVRLGPITGGILIEVADAGPGMSANDAIRAFDRFHRAAERNGGGWGSGTGPGDGSRPGEPPAAERSGGSGLGLSIVQAIANAHGGRATLESRPGKGTKVRVWLPVRIVP